MARNSSSIQLVFFNNGKRIKMATGMDIKPTMWVEDLMRARIHFSNPESNVINQRLDALESAVNHIEYDIKMRRINISSNEFIDRIKKRGQLFEFIKDGKEFWYHFEEFIAHQKKHYSHSIYRDYHNSLRKHLKTLEDQYDRIISLQGFKRSSDSLFDLFYNHLAFEALNKDGEKGMSINTVGKNVKNLKAFLHWVFDRDICVPYSLKHMVVEQIDTDTVYLNQQEINVLAETSELNKKETEVRDLFIIGCETGLRLKNLINLRAENYQSGQLIFYQVKTQGRGSKLIIPLSDLHETIIEKYNFNPPCKKMGTDEFNRILRKVCEKAGIDSEVMIQKVNKYHTTEIVYKKHELISSHTARRSFCTNKFLLGMPVQAIMKFSGHKTERAFMKYLKLDAEITAKKFKKYF